VERFFEAESTEATRANFSIAEAVQKIAAYNARADLDNEHQLLLFLQSWWSNLYNKPLKDPILASYTLEELLYEFYDRLERQRAREENIQTENDRIEEAKDKAVEDWIREEENKELLKDDQKNTDDKQSDPTKDPENIKWMQEQIDKAKNEYGETFGEDIIENFE